MGCPWNSSTSSVALHTSSLSPNSFFLSLTSTSVCNPLWPFHALLDSGSSHSFVNEVFAMDNKLKFSYLLNPILLKMFNGSTPSNISKKVQMLITFSTGETHHLELFVTSLDENYSLILGYDWLAWHNLSIDWMETKNHILSHSTLEGVQVQIMQSVALEKLVDDREEAW